MVWDKGSFMEGAIAGAVGGGTLGTVAAPGIGTLGGAAIGGIIGAVIKSPLFVILGSILIGIFLLGGATIIGNIPWWILAVVTLLIIFKFTKNK